MKLSFIILTIFLTIDILFSFIIIHSFFFLSLLSLCFLALRATQFVSFVLYSLHTFLEELSARTFSSIDLNYKSVRPFALLPFRNMICCQESNLSPSFTSNWSSVKIQQFLLSKKFFNAFPSSKLLILGPSISKQFVLASVF